MTSMPRGNARRFSDHICRKTCGNPCGAVCRSSRIPGPVNRSGVPPSKAATSIRTVVERSGYSCVPTENRPSEARGAPASNTANRARLFSVSSNAPLWKASQPGTPDLANSPFIQKGVSWSQRVNRTAPAAFPRGAGGFTRLSATWIVPGCAIPSISRRNTPCDSKTGSAKPPDRISPLRSISRLLEPW
ncbi:hypothetical protein D3C80_1591770 [compost metagenome]